MFPWREILAIQETAPHLLRPRIKQAEDTSVFLGPAVFALLAAVGYGSYTVLVKAASSHLSHQMLGAAAISCFAALTGGVFLLLSSAKITTASIDARGILLLALAGVAAFLTEYLVFQGYARGLSMNVINPIAFGGGLALAAIVGLLMGESMSILKLVGILAIILGTSVLLMNG